VISVVIVNWNSGPLLESCVRSLLRFAEGCEIVIVDNASDDSSLHFAEKVGNGIAILCNEQNLGFAAGNNLGWRVSKGDKILFLNPDTECLPESVNRLDQTFAADKMVWAAGGKLVSPTGQPQPRFNVRAFPSIGSVAADMLLLNEIWPCNPWSGLISPNDDTHAVDVDQPAAACLMVTRKCMESVGGFDESFRPAWFEDVDLCLRIRNHGGRIQYQPGARFLHHGGYSLGHLSRKDFLEIFHANQIRYFRKHHGYKTAMRVKRWIMLGLAIRSALSLAWPPTPGISRAASAKMYWNAARHISLSREVVL
jgi:N-acetylglucosaminyl-diphospho-decaprenol L-rhamnosyltransferase